MKRAIHLATAFALTTLCLCANAGAKVATIEIPGAIFVAPLSINDKGQITGVYADASKRRHGFLWQPHAALATFDVASADDTYPSAISAAGVITGWCYGSGLDAGFVRAADGSTTIFNVPRGTITRPAGINRNGWIAGYVLHGVRDRHPIPFLMSPSGDATEFTVPGATGGASGVVVNNSQMVAGQALVETDDGRRGFIRTPDGTATMFGAPNVDFIVAGMNDAGTIAGTLAADNLAQGFIRTIDGTLTYFIAPNGSLSTVIAAINNAGTIAGGFVDSEGRTWHGFIRTADETFTPFDVRGSTYTQILAMNNKGAIAGVYTNKDGVTLAFAGKP